MSDGLQKAVFVTDMAYGMVMWPALSGPEHLVRGTLHHLYTAFKPNHIGTWMTGVQGAGRVPLPVLTYVRRQYIGHEFRCRTKTVISILDGLLVSTVHGTTTS